MDASEENDGYSSTEEPMNSDPEEEGGKKLVSHRSEQLQLHRTPCPDLVPITMSLRSLQAGTW